MEQGFVDFLFDVYSLKTPPHESHDGTGRGSFSSFWGLVNFPVVYKMGPYHLYKWNFVGRTL